MSDVTVDVLQTYVISELKRTKEVLHSIFLMCQLNPVHQAERKVWLGKNISFLFYLLQACTRFEYSMTITRIEAYGNDKNAYHEAIRILYQIEFF